MEFVGLLFLWVLMGGVAAIIAQYKNRSLLEGFVLGALCGCFGVIIEALLPRQLPKAPPGMWATKCPRCNAVQNVSLRATTFECWQCHITVRTGVAAPPSPIPVSSKRRPTDPEKTRNISCPSCQAELWIKPSTEKFRCAKCHTVSDVAPR